MKSEKYRDKTEHRKKVLIDFLKKKLKENPSKDTFSCGVSEISNFNILLGDPTILKRSISELSKLSEGNIVFEKIEQRSSIHTATGEETIVEVSYWFNVKDLQELEEQENEISENIKELEKVVQFVLHDNGQFYPLGHSGEKFQMETDKTPYKLLKFLAEKQVYVKTEKLSTKFKVSNVEIRKKISSIRDVMVNKYGLPRDSIFENNKKMGYRVTNLIIKN